MENTLKQQPANCIKIVLFGPESTGKTTLSKMLAKHYKTVWVPEYARTYLQNKWDNEGKICEPDDLLPIAIGQMQLENQLAQNANRLLICDTDLLETKVYSETYYNGFCPPLLKKYALKNTYDLYFLTYIDVPWEADDLRDKPHEREAMFKAFQNELITQKLPYVLLKGDKTERFNTAINHINKTLFNNTVMFNTQDVKLFEKKGISQAQVESQVSMLKHGMSYSDLVSAATIGHGITRYDATDTETLIRYYETEKEQVNIVKFVPASGAASRMFKFLFQFLNEFDPFKDTITSYAERKGDTLIKTFAEHLEQFPFYNTVRNKLKAERPNVESLAKAEMYKAFVETMLREDGLNFSFLPKGLLPFHNYNDGPITAFQEHLFESTLYASSKNTANLHFTVSEKHHTYFENELAHFKPQLEKKTNTTFNVSYSYQKEATETLALTLNNDIYRNDDGSILFRPGGHGALLQNLNALDNDIVFIKNIDNIVVAPKNIKISEYKKLLGGVLLKAQKDVFGFLHALDAGTISEETIETIKTFLLEQINVVVNKDFDSLSHGEKITYLKDKLNRPIRVCGIVKNEGEPGGGPFWVKDKNGNISLQIVEFAQIDFDDSSQRDIADNATHFNPTDFVCGIKNYKGEVFDLMQYVDPDAAFITMKTQNGVDIKVLELPGLWNGSMAHWNSICVEVPVETFNPVKTVNDLLKPAHQV